VSESERNRTIFEQLSFRVRIWLDRQTPPDSLVLVLSALVVGIGGGLGAVLFVWLLRQVSDVTRWLITNPLGNLPDMLALMIVMGAAGVIVGLIVAYLAPEVRGSGIPELMEAVALHGGRIRPRVVPLKLLASAVTIGAGGSAGREGPIVHIGPAFGSTVAQLLHFSNDRVRTLLACGAAAGVAATFNSPIAGAIFALEVILGRFTIRYFGAVVISSVAAAIVGRAFLGDIPAFAVPAYTLNSLKELPIYVVLALLSALLAIAFIAALYNTRKFFLRLKAHVAVEAALGMMITAALASLAPSYLILGPGLNFIGDAIAHDFSMPLSYMAGLIVLKIVATSFTLGSGNSGGVFAPALFLGAVLGGLVGTVANTVWPEIALHPGAYAIVGMAAVFAGAARAPITAVIIVFEMSGDYKLILPLMMATVLSTFVAEHLMGDSIYSINLRHKGLNLQQGRDVDLMQCLTVGEAMTKDPLVVDETLPLTELDRLFQRTHGHSFPVVDQDHRLVGMVSITDYDREARRGQLHDRRVADIATKGNILIAYEDEALSDALQRIGTRDINKLPVVSRLDTASVVGVVRRRDIIRAYNVALSRRAKDQLAEDQLQLRSIDNTKFLEIEIEATSQAIGRPLAEVGPTLPHECVVVSIRRQGSVLIPHGDTVLQAGDQINFFLRRSDEAQLKACLKPPGGHPVSRFE
jgi:CIC family chloride channel protein